jgi:hypothetical protein
MNSDLALVDFLNLDMNIENFGALPVTVQTKTKFQAMLALDVIMGLTF